eukprot:11183293-Lingulodinium_polyedra.AAC.1
MVRPSDGGGATGEPFTRAALAYRYSGLWSGGCLQANAQEWPGAARAGRSMRVGSSTWRVTLGTARSNGR